MNRTLSTLCQKSLIFFTCLSFIYQFHSFPVMSDAAPVAELDQTAIYSTSQSNAVSSSQLSAVVEQAVSSSVETLGANATLNNSTTCQLVNNIVTKLLEAGVQTTPKCKPRTLQELKQKFLDSEINSEGFSPQSPHDGCIGLEKLTGFKNDIYYISTSSSCTATSNNIRIDPVCYGNGNHSHCSMDTELQPIIEDVDQLENYFPQYVLQIVCRGCSKNDNQCLQEHNSCYVHEKRSPSFHALRRDTSECDENGYEKWIFDDAQHVVVACSCRQRSE